MPLADRDREALCRIAREALGAAVDGRSYVPENPGLPGLEERRGCFVTLRTGGRLRGCLGCFVSERPLYQTVADYAAHSALEDPRFVGDRLRPEELPLVDLDISALTPLEPCADPLAIVPGVHGIYVKKGGRSGCFLPQVATEMGWDAEEFLGHCCRDKAGLEWDAWRRPGATVMTFTAEVVDCPADP